ncbi:MAG: tyrosine-type recombinase/integrase [Acidimicrobiales bacterium]
MAEIVKRTTRRGDVRYDARVWMDGRGLMKTFRRRKDAEAWAADAEARRYSGLLVDPAGGPTTVSQLAQLWLASNPAKRESTIARDRAAIDRHILEAIGGCRIGSVRPPDIQQLVSCWSSLMAPKTVARTYGTLRAMFAYAVNTDLLVRSPCRGINLPTGTRRPPRALTQDQVAAIASKIDERFQLMVWLAAMLGLRWVEVAGIRVGSVDLPGHTVTIAGAVVRDGHGRSVMGPPKTRAGVRTLSLPETLASELRAHIAALGPAGSHPDALLFSAAGGSRMSYSNGMKRGLPR